MSLPDDERPAAHRQFFADVVTAPVKAFAPAALREAFLTERREAFLGPGPWEVFAGGTYIRTPSADPAFVYQDVLVRLKGDANMARRAAPGRAIDPAAHTVRRAGRDAARDPHVF